MPVGSRWFINLGVVAASLVLVASIVVESGRMQESNGLGYDGRMYALMTTDALYRGGDNPRMRPLVILINQVVYDVFDRGVIRTFQAMNVVYSAVLALLLCGILDRYGVPAAHKFVFALNIFATIAVAKMFAFYPVLVDLGAYAFVALAVYAILHGSRALIVLTTILAVLSREFGMVAILFGVHRDIRLRVAPRIIAATYVPGAAAFIALRQWVLATSPQRVEGALLSGSDILANLSGFVDPLFLMFLAYFALTVFGGISLMLVTQALRRRITLDGETEWLTYLGAIGVLTLVGSADLWRYLAFALPAVAVLYAKSLAREDWFVVAAWTGFVTVLTQQPWVTMTELTYFEDWFPLYLPQFGVPTDPSPAFWAAWAVRITIVAGVAVLMWRAQRPRHLLGHGRAGISELAVPKGV